LLGTVVARQKSLGSDLCLGELVKVAQVQSARQVFSGTRLCPPVPLVPRILALPAVSHVCWAHPPTWAEHVQELSYLCLLHGQ
jgi:hypothetical protein